MWNIRAKQIRDRLDSTLQEIGSADITDTGKMRSLWAIMSDIQLWMEDMEQRMKIEAEY